MQRAARHLIRPVASDLKYRLHGATGAHHHMDRPIATLRACIHFSILHLLHRCYCNGCSLSPFQGHLESYDLHSTSQAEKDELHQTSKEFTEPVAGNQKHELPSLTHDRRGNCEGVNENCMITSQSYLHHCDRFINATLTEENKTGGTVQKHVNILSSNIADSALGTGNCNFMSSNGVDCIEQGLLHSVSDKDLRCDAMMIAEGSKMTDVNSDASLVCFILDQYGWSPKTVGLLQPFVGRFTPELVNRIITDQKNAKLAMSFLEWAGDSENYKFQEEVFTKIIGRLGKDMDFSTAWNVLQFMRKHDLEVDYAFGVFIHRLKNADMVNEVVIAIDKMETLNVIPTVPLYTLAFQLILKDNNLREAQMLYEKMCQIGLQPDTKLYNVLISGFGRAGKIDDAVFLFRDMHMHHIDPDNFTYVNILRAYARTDQYEEGQKVYTEMIQKGYFPKVFSQLDLKCILHGVKTMHQIETFFQGIELRGHVISVYTYNNLIQYLLDRDMFHEAVKVFCRLTGQVQFSSERCKTSTKPNSDSYSLLIHGLCKGGKSKDALHFYREMLINGFKASADICNCLLVGLSNATLIYEAVELSDHIANEKLVIESATQKTFFRALHNSGDLSKALSIFEIMKWRGCIEQSSNLHAIIGIEL